MPIFRNKPKRRRSKSPYPQAGTPSGDAVIGPCNGEGCDRILKRHDIFFCMADGKTLCLDCCEKVPGVQLSAMILKEPTETVSTAIIWDGEFPS